ncbi:MAG: YccF domain-containing protein [Clostridia bacterium]|nr:YccF domain-containing protein [Clostridia bacterium]
MRFLGNVLWFFLGGFLSGMGWIIAGLLWCITILGIPIGLQCFKLASVSFWPFGKEIVYSGGAVSFLVNVLWFLFSGLELALGNFLLGCLLCITIVGIPFGKQFFKIAKLALAPFGAVIVRV